MTIEFLPGHSWVHRLDPRVKFTMLGAGIIALISFDDPALSFLIALAFLSVMATAGLPRSFWLTAVMPLAPTFVLFSALNFIAITSHPAFFMATDSPAILFTIFGKPFYLEGGLYILNVVFKFGGIILLSRSILAITPTKELVVGLARMRLPAEFCVAISIAMAYVPVLIGETRTILQAMQARGKRVYFRNPIRQLQAMTSLFLPSLVSSLQRSQKIAATLEARGFTYDVGNRTFSSDIAMGTSDRVAMAVLAAVAIGCVIVGRWGLKIGTLHYEVSFQVLGWVQSLIRTLA